MADIEQLVEFLCGAAPIDGVWFSDRHHERDGQFWWRKDLREAVTRLRDDLAAVAAERDKWRDDATHRSTAIRTLTADLAAMTAERDRFLRAALRTGIWRYAPCVICGYNGHDYYQPKTHECARLAAEMEKA